MKNTEQLWVIVVIFAGMFLAFFIFRRHHLEPVQKDRRRPRSKLSEHPFRVGDILLFSGQGRAGAFVSLATKIFAATPFTHIGMVYMKPGTRTPLVWEMFVPNDDNEDFAVGKRTRATNTRIMALVPYVTKYIENGGHVCARSLTGPKPIDPKRLAQIIAAFSSKKNYSYLTALACAYTRCFPMLPAGGFVDTEHSTFCSEMIAETMEQLGILDFSHGSDFDRRLVMPGDFQQDERTLPFCYGWRLGPEVLLEVQ